MKEVLFIPDEQAMFELASRLAALELTTAIFYLYGELGAGKTTFVRGFLRGLGYKNSVKSPTYTLVEEYSFKKFHVFHFDLYRLNQPQELDYLGIEDYFIPNAICFVEWPEKGVGKLPLPDLSCYIEHAGDARKLKLIAHSVLGEEIMRRITE